MAFFDKDFKELLSSELISIIIGLAAGTVLAVYKKEVFIIPGMFIILPGLLEMRGNISGSFASRLSSGLFLGAINPKKVHSRIIKGNLVASFFLAFFVSLALGLLAFLFNFFVFKIISPQIIFIPLVAGLIANLIEIPLALFGTLYLFRKGHDPNNIMGPFVTSTGDITTIISLLIAVVVIL